MPVPPIFRALCLALASLLLWAGLAWPGARPVGAQSARSYAARADAMQLAADIAAQRQLPPEWVRATLAQAQFQPQVQRLMTPPAPGGGAAVPDWGAYRRRFVEARRIRAGVRFWQTHASALERATREYGVPAHIIVGIIGVETLYGQKMGNWRVIDALATLALDFPASHPRAAARGAYFRGELAQLLDFSHRAGIDPRSLRGSYAGAMGLGQFMPSSWAQWGVDFDGDGRADLFASAPDAIGSVANYLAAHHWQSGVPTHYPAHIQTAAGEAAQAPADLPLGIRPQWRLAQLRARGVQLPDAAAAHPGPLALVKFDNGPQGAPLYIAGTQNFYAITRYNQSSFYALAVIELGQAVQAALDKEALKQ